MTPLRRRLAASATALLLLAADTSAHERWVPHTLLRAYDERAFRTWTPVNAAIALGLVALVGALVWIARSRPTAGAEARPLASPAGGPWLVRTGTGLALLVLALGDAFVAPDLVADGTAASRLLIGLTLTTSAALLVGWRVSECALVLGFAYLVAIAWRPFQAFDGRPIAAADVLVYFELLALLGYLHLRSARDGARTLLATVSCPAHAPRKADTRRAAVRLVQRVIGLNVLVHGVLKVVHPDLPMGVLQNHTESIYAPVAALLPLSEETFVLCAAACEAAIGSLILLGAFPRAAILALLGVVLATGFVFRGELLGHLPRVAGVLALLLAETDALDRRAALLDGLRSRFRALRAGRATERRGSLASLVGILLVSSAAFALLDPGARDALEATPESSAAYEDDYRPPPADAPRAEVVLGEPATARGSSDRLTFELEPLPAALRVGEVFSLHFRVSTEDARPPVTGEDLRVHIGMPRHGHGMPTRTVLHARGAGRFELAGCQLNMYGLWTVEIEIEGRDRAVFELRYRARDAG